MSSKVGDETIRNVNLVTVTDPLLGQVVDSYKIESLVGSGAMGMVYRGVHQIIGKAAAIKVLKQDYADDPEMVQRLVREARTVNAIRHPAIVDIFGFGTLSRTDQPYIVMDLLEGDPLDEYIKEHAPMRLRELAPFIDELLGALAAAHAVGVIHRDLKPGNVFVEKKADGQKGIKVIDFGLAKMADRAGGSVRPTNPGTMLGTPAFMAPEQVMGTKVTPATDLYAVGGIAYQMITNHLPHEAPSAIEVLSQKMSHDPVRPKQWQPDLEDELDAWVMNLLSREPEARYQTAEEARHALRRIVDGRTSAVGASGKAPAHKPSAAGVVPRREWAEAKTLVTEPVAPPEGLGDLKASEVSTNDHVSPWAKTAALPPTDPGPLKPRYQSSRQPVLAVAANPDEVVRSQAPGKKQSQSNPAVPPPKKASQSNPVVSLPPANPGEATQPPELPPPSRTPLYIALLLAIIALLSGLILLVSKP